MIQVLQGISISPQGTNNRFVQENWPNSFAFGGYIYSVQTSIGFSNRPTEVKISIVLQTSTFSQSAAYFDINDGDLQCGAGVGGLNNESWYNINIEGLTLSNFMLWSYDFSIEAGQKALHVVFKDYSIILDKIYIGLFKKQGYLYPHVANCQIQLPVRCQDCEYSGAAVTGTGIALRDIGYASYAGINGQTYDSFSNVYYGEGNVFDAWQLLMSGLVTPGGQFDLNGGYLILGSESATEARCDNAPNISYSFVELLASLRNNGLIFTGAFPFGTGDSDYVYRNSHIGTLREVLQNWCSDLAYDFYCSGRQFIGINMQNPINISGIVQMVDPTTPIGQYFTINSPNGTGAILSFKSTTSLDNTFRQAVVVENSYPITQKDVNKQVKRYVGITPLHPISINQINLYGYGANGQPLNLGVLDYNVYGTPFVRPPYEITDFDNGTYQNSYYDTFGRLDGRSYNDVDAAIALSNYNDTLRDIFVGQRALFNVNSPNYGASGPIQNPYCVANFNALGMFPILEITGTEFKAEIIEQNFKNGEKDGVANLNTDQQYFRVFLGYYNSDFKSDIVDWEKAAAKSMYKYGIITQGVLTGEPYVPYNLLNDLSPTAGFYGQSGLTYQRIQNSFVPTTDLYPSAIASPFIDILLYSGYVKNGTASGIYYSGNPLYPPWVPPGYSDYPGRIPTGLWVSTLDNPWGTVQADFDRQLSYAFGDPCAQNYNLSQSVQNVLTDTDKNLQDWKLEFFRPIVNPDLSTINDIITSDEFDFETIVDEVVTTYTDFHWMKRQYCKKLHILIIPDTINHPNIKALFTPNRINSINPQTLNIYRQKVYEANLRKNTTETPSICSLSLLEEMCQNILSGGTGLGFGNGISYNFNPPLTNQQTGCVILENKNNFFIEGFPLEYINGFSGYLSRSLSLSITKNPSGYNIGPSTDENGDFYYSDLANGVLSLTGVTANLNIVYPLQAGPNGEASYLGIYTSDLTTEYRIPAFTQIFGTPVNVTNNNVASFKIINDIVDNTLDPQLNPLTNEVVPYITIISGGGANSIVATPQQYYNFVQNLNNYQLLNPTKNVDVVLAGAPDNYGNFVQYLTPLSGLTQISMSVSDRGVTTSLTFADRPKVMPKQEAIINKIGPRIKGNYS